MLSLIEITAFKLESKSCKGFCLKKKSSTNENTWICNRSQFTWSITWLIPKSYRQQPPYIAYAEFRYILSIWWRIQSVFRTHVKGLRRQEIKNGHSSIIFLTKNKVRGVIQWGKQVCFLVWNISDNPARSKAEILQVGTFFLHSISFTVGF